MPPWLHYTASRLLHANCDEVIRRRPYVSAAGSGWFSVGELPLAFASSVPSVRIDILSFFVMNVSDLAILVLYFGL